jgi:hypothetical protein
MGGRTKDKLMRPSCVADGATLESQKWRRSPSRSSENRVRGGNRKARQRNVGVVGQDNLGGSPAYLF